MTSSNTVAGQAAAGAGIGPGAVGYVLGITKAYTTRVGGGPFPTELTDEIGETLGRKGHEFGVVTGRKRRCGWFDAVMVRQAIKVGGITGIALTKLDVLDGFDEIKVCTGYRCRGEIYDHLPALASAQAEVEPIYETFEGWSELHARRPVLGRSAGDLDQIYPPHRGADRARRWPSSRRARSATTRSWSAIPSRTEPYSAGSAANARSAGAAVGMGGDIAVDMRRQLFHVMVEEMVGAGDDAVIDLDVALMRELGDQLLRRLERHDRVLVAMDDEAGGRARRQEAEIVEIGGRRHGDEAGDLGPPHQQLHADPGAEGKTGDPAGLGIGIVALQPVERRGGVRQLALAAREAALAAADAAEIEAQGREAALGEGAEQGIDDLVVHRPAMLRMRMQQQGDRRVGLLGMLIAALEPAFRTVDDDLRHCCAGPRWYHRLLFGWAGINPTDLSRTIHSVRS